MCDEPNGPNGSHLKQSGSSLVGQQYFPFNVKSDFATVV